MKQILHILICLCTATGFSQVTCQTAQAITTGTYQVTLAQNSQTPTPVCAAGTQNTPNRGAWFTYTATQTQGVTVSTDLDGYPKIDTRVHIYSGNCNALVCVAGDDDSGANYTSVVTFNATQGQTYYIAFDNNWTSNGFYFNLTAGTPPPSATLTGTYKICVVDMNGDYLDDLVGIHNNNIHVLYQNADGTFTSAMLPVPGTITNMPSWSMAAGDYNKDGFNDLLLGGGNGATLLLSNNTGTAFTVAHNTPQYVFSQRTNFVDINNDGQLDAFVCHDVAPNVYFKNNGTGGFTFHQGGLGDVSNGGNYGSIWIDFDNDGDQDLFIAKCRGGNNVAAIDELHRNNGNGTFTNIATTAGFADYHQSWSAAWADFDNDGDMDVMIGASSTTGGSHKLMRNDGNGTFTNVTVGSGYDTFTSLSQEHCAHDFNNDGFVDIFGGGSKIMYNNGNMTFTPVQSFATNGAVGDINNDGFLDFLNGSVVKLNPGNNNNWIKLNLKGTTSNSNGIGARVEIYGAWGKQIRDVRSGDGFEFMSSLNPHFGIGTAAAIDKVIIRWPSGVVDTINNPAINQSLFVTEGSTLGLGNTISSAFVVYPNPVKDYIEIQGDNASQIMSAKIYDMNGRLVKSATPESARISAQGLTRGNYILILLDKDGKQHTQKIIKG
ncbi:MAG: FG-GAP-like repeat-containing protein [Flavobacterium sp.]